MTAPRPSRMIRTRESSGATLPAGVGEVGHVGNVRDTPAVDAVAADAVAVVETHDDTPFLVGAEHPVPLPPLSTLKTSPGPTG